MARMDRRNFLKSAGLAHGCHAGSDLHGPPRSPEARCHGNRKVRGERGHMNSVLASLNVRNSATRGDGLPYAV